MMVEETCPCGAKLILRGDSSASRAMRSADEREIWKQVERWRRLHRALEHRADDDVDVLLTVVVDAKRHARRERRMLAREARYDPDAA